MAAALPNVSSDLIWEVVRKSNSAKPADGAGFNIAARRPAHILETQAARMPSWLSAPTLAVCSCLATPLT